MSDIKYDVLLTIGIPTYNGAKFIRQTLDCIISQVSVDHKYLVEILVSDNASTDSTPDIVNDFAKTSLIPVLYFRNSENIGYDRNVDQLFKRARGRYVEILGDDDFYRDDTCLSKILSRIATGVSYGVLMLPIDFLEINSGSIFSGVRVPSDVECKTGDEFFRQSKWGTAAVSSLIISRDAWNEAPISKYYGTQWVHIGGIVNVLSKSGLAYIFCDPMITVRISNNRWQGNFGNQLECGLDHLLVLKDMLDLGYIPQTYDFFYRERYRKNLIDILTTKPASYAKRIAIMKKMAFFFGSHIVFWLVHVPAMFLPKWVNYPLVVIRRTLRRIKKSFQRDQEVRK